MDMSKTHQEDNMNATTAPNTITHVSQLLGKDRPQRPTADISELRLGQVAIFHSRGQYRTGVVTKIGRTNIKASYMTPGGLADAAKRLQSVKESYAEGWTPKMRAAEKKGRQNYAYRCERLAKGRDKWDSDERWAELEAQVAAGEQDAIDEAVAYALKRWVEIEEWATTCSVEDFATVTNKSTKEFWLAA